MLVSELYKMNFDDAVEALINEDKLITTYDTLKDFAKSNIDDDTLLLSIHILQAISENTEEYYSYDYSMGTLETPKALSDLSDLEEFCED